MPLPLAFLTKQYTDTAGTGTVTLGVSDARFRTIATATGSVSTAVGYRVSLDGSGQWEIGVGVHNGASPGTLTRATVLANNLGTTSPVSFVTGRKDVQIVSFPGQRATFGFTTNTTAALADLGSILNFTGTASTTLTLPAAASVPLGAGYVVRNDAATGSLLTVDGNASELVGTATTQVVCPGETLEIWSTGTAWLHSTLPPRALLRVYSLGAGVATLDIALPAGSGAIYEIAMRKVNPSVNLLLSARTSTNGGVSFDTGASDYSRSYDFQDGATGSNRGSNVGSEIVICDSYTASNIFNLGFMFDAGTAAMFPRIYDGHALGQQSTSGLLARGAFSGGRAAVGPANAIRILTTSGNISGGTATVYLHRA